MTLLLTQGCLVKSISFGEKIQSKLCLESLLVHSLLVLDRVLHAIFFGTSLGLQEK